MHEQRFQFGAEDQHAVVEHRVVERLHAQAVACQEQRLAVAIRYREREHPAKALHARFAPSLPRVNDHFGIAAGAEHMAQRLQFGNQFLVVVDLAVVDDRDAAVFVVQRLLAGRQIDDRQPPVAEAHPRLQMQSAFVGAAVELRLVHPIEEATVDFPPALAVENTCYSAHRIVFPSSMRS